MGKDNPSIERTLSKAEAVETKAVTARPSRFPLLNEGWAAFICASVAHNPYKLFRGQDCYSAFHLQLTTAGTDTLLSALDTHSKESRP